MSLEKFTITCEKCGSNSVEVWSGYGGEIYFSCNDCDNDEEN